MKKTCLLIVLAGCLPTTAFVRTVPTPDGERHARPASAVEVFFGNAPLKPHERVGYFDRTPSDYVADAAIDVIDDLRRIAGYHGCDGVLLPSKDELVTLAKSSTAKARAYCVMYEKVAAKPAARDDPNVLLRLGAAAETANDLEQARSHYDQACKQSIQRGCTHLGILRLNSGDEAGALELFTRACVLDDAIACRYQGVMYVEGKGGATSGTGGVTYLDKACQAKDGWACWRIAQVLKTGEGGAAKDSARVDQYMALACTNGHQAACTQ